MEWRRRSKEQDQNKVAHEFNEDRECDLVGVCSEGRGEGERSGKELADTTASNKDKQYNVRSCQDCPSASSENAADIAQVGEESTFLSQKNYPIVSSAVKT